MSYYFSIRREVERIKPIVDFIRDTLNYSEKEKAINILDLIKKLDIKIKYDKEITRPIFIVVGKKPYIKIKNMNSYSIKNGNLYWFALAFILYG